MPSYSNFQSDNAKYTNIHNRNTHNPEFNPTVSAMGNSELSSFEKNLNKYIDFASWLNW